MSMDLSGIENEAEFFPAGTLSDSLQDELREVTSRWSRLESKANPIERLTRCAEPYLTALKQIRNAKDIQRRAEIRREVTHTLITALGYDYKRTSLHIALEGEPVVPALSRVADVDGRDVAWLIEAPLEGPDDETTDPLGTSFETDQFPEEEREFAETNLAIEEILSDGIFGLRNSPRHVLVFGLSQIVLIDRHKWPARSVLRFDLQEIFSRKDTDTLTVMACLISREARVPQQGVPIADRIEEEAQRNANAVTTSLKRTVRDAIEILGQEVLDVTGGKYPSGPRKGVWIEGPELSLECLRYMYRLLFLFYAEANPRLNVLDLKNPVYASGYSIEALRELESVRLRTPLEKTGTYLWQSLQRTLTILYQGDNTVMRLPTVKVSLLDPDSTPILNEVKLRNEAIQKVIRLLSLKQSRSGTARISYAKLGIGQLGAVYETLISFTGVVAKQDLIELRPQTGRGSTVANEGEDDQDSEEQDLDGTDEDDEGNDGVGADEDSDEEAVSRRDKIDLLAPSYFVARSRASEFRPEEIIFDGAEARVYKKGTFIYRLAGRDREKSASYYTPEPLARLLVKHALMERCKDLSADELLELKILEPAMGSAAFLVETTNQLADLYLERKQREVGKTIPQDQIIIEKQRVRAFIADRNCFGVDLNPVAVELGAISLWLNSLHASDFSPWFGDQLHAGNSLIGARRAAYDPKLMSARNRSDLWFNEKPQEIGWKGRLPDGYIWQFLLPAKDMAKFDSDKSISEFAGQAQEKIKNWRRGGFFDKLEPHELKLLQKLSRIADELFDIVAEELAKSRAASNDAITIWPDKQMPGVKGLDFNEKAKRLKRLVGADHASNTLPYKRLKIAMDAWCALWLWPLDKADLLPTRAEFLHGMSMILEGGFMPDGSLAVPSVNELVDPTPDFFNTLEPGAPATDLFKAAAKKSQDLFRETDVDQLVQEMEWLAVAVDVANQQRFAHFDLIFADVLKTRGGFDLIVGNPPWAKPTWNEADVIGDIDPGFVVKNHTAAEARQLRSAVLTKPSAKDHFLTAFVKAKGAMTVTGSAAMNPFCGGGSNNLYRCFIDLSLRIAGRDANIALIHQDSHLTDSNEAVTLRMNWYKRIRAHYHFRNEMKAKNFSEIGNTREFSLNIYGPEDENVCFLNAANLLSATQLADCLRHDGSGPVPSLKDKLGKWDVRGHRDRVVVIDKSYLTALHAAFGGEGELLATRLVSPFSRDIAQAILAAYSRKPLAAQNVTWQASGMWTENTAVSGGQLMKETRFPSSISTAVYSGGIIFVGNPYYKAPRRGCRSHRDFECIDLEIIPNDFLPRTNFQVVEQEPAGRPGIRWSTSGTHSDHYRVGLRKMLGQNGERTLSGSILPPRLGHINGIQSAAFAKQRDLIIANALWTSIPFDFLMKASNRQNLYEPDLAALPWIDPGATALHRGLRLACLTEFYAELWNAEAIHLSALPWHTSDPRLGLDGPTEGPPTWDRSAGLRTDFSRRLALVEIDVLVAQSLGLTLGQLIDIYRIYFPVLHQNEAGTWYDRKGRIVWTCSKGLPGVGYLEDGKSPSRKRWEQILASGKNDLECVAVVDFIPGGPHTVTRTFEGPFDTCDRVEDYKRAWAYFEDHKAKEEAA